jgi:hypothetical protein
VQPDLREIVIRLWLERRAIPQNSGERFVRGDRLEIVPYPREAFVAVLGSAMAVCCREAWVRGYFKYLMSIIKRPRAA